MAERKLFICSECGKSIQVWSDGNPYFIDIAGQKQYAYHPDHEALDKCIGNDTPYLCLSCGAEFMVDSRSPTTICPNCKSTEVVDIFLLEGGKCPDCNKGTFKEDTSKMCIS